MKEQTSGRPHAQTAEDKKPEHYAADWWIYLALAIFIGGLVFLTYALTLRGEVMSEFGKPAGQSPAAPAAAPAPAEKK